VGLSNGIKMGLKNSFKLLLSNQLKLRCFFFACLVGLLLGSPTGCMAKVTSNEDDLTKQAIQLFENKKTQQAIDLERKAVKQDRGKCLPHAVLSYFLFEDSKSPEALAEGRMATRLAPRNSIALVNLGIMQQALGDQKSALVCFSKSRDVNPSDWKAWIGQAQSLMLMGRRDESILILQEMLSRKSTDFDWQYQLGQALLYFDKPHLATITANNAVKLANTPEQKSTALFQLFLAYIRDNDVKHADELMHQVISENKPTDAQIYVQAALTLSVLKPEASQEILVAAVRNLDKSDDSGTFFRLAQILDDKARFVAYDRTKYGAWLNTAELAYRQAIKLNASPPIYCLGLASVLAEQGKADELVQELSKANAADVQDQLPGYLLSKMKPVQIASTDHHSNLPSTLPNFGQVELTKAQFAIKGLNCACKRSIIINSFKQIRGLVLTTISPKFPFVATILIDESMIPLSDALVKMTNRPLPELSYKLLSSKPIKGAGEALKIDLDGRNLIFHPFANDWTQLKPTLPEDSIAICNSSR
jgi:tetratricopeptide (TPR) repeat protein